MWKKGNKVYTGGGIIVRNAKGIDIWWSKPTDAQFLAAGWEEFTPEPPTPAPKRYSKLKIIRAFGERWEAWKLQLEQTGLYDQFIAAAWLDENDPAFAAVLATLSDAEKELLAGCEYE